MVYKDFNGIIAFYIIVLPVLYCYNYYEQLLVVRYITLLYRGYFP